MRHIHQREALNTEPFVSRLENYQFGGCHASHIGAIKSVLDFLGIHESTAWIFGMTGHAFMLVLDEHVNKPNSGTPEPELFELAQNLGLQIEGLHAYAPAADVQRLQEEAWAQARIAIRQGYPVFSKNIDIENETSIIYACDNAGYYTHSWHAGFGADGCDDVIPWNRLGMCECPCMECRTSRDAAPGRNPDQDAPILISLHWAKKMPPQAPAVSLRQALTFALSMNEQGQYEQNNMRYYSGLSAYDHWIAKLEKGAIEAYCMGYYGEVWHESKRYAHQFLIECQARIPETAIAAESLQEAIHYYKEISKKFKKVSDMFPWMQPRERIQDRERRMAAVMLLKEIRRLEEKAFASLRKLAASL